jgi:hypothetical protein
MGILLMLHWALRWAILVVAALLVFKFVLGWSTDAAFKGMDRGLAAGFSGLMDIQAVIGLVYLLWDGFSGAGFPAFRIEHGIAMILAASAAHLPARFKTLPDKLRFQYSLFAVLGSLALVFIGLAFLPAD